MTADFTGQVHSMVNNKRPEIKRFSLRLSQNLTVTQTASWTDLKVVKRNARTLTLTQRRTQTERRLLRNSLISTHPPITACLTVCHSTFKSLSLPAWPRPPSWAAPVPWPITALLPHPTLWAPLQVTSCDDITNDKKHVSARVCVTQMMNVYF